ncbi:MAG: MBOAT family protein [Candidatus Hydrogenedentes bacterium]|nr:MBOAT family protein [Candidatus Hydrogenedentota bacterium]
MSFASIQYAVFLITVYGLYRMLPHRQQNLMLLVASDIFYGAWDWRFLSLMLISTVIDYGVALRLRTAEAPGIRKALLLASICTNLGLLGVFKYFNFFASSLADLASAFGITLHWTTLSIVLPVGISFYTFQTLSYTIDVYRRELEATDRFFDFALFVSFFPQLVAGPIERASHLLPQVLKPRTITWDQTTRGIYLIAFGLFKKVVVADGVAHSVDTIYNAGLNVTWADIVLATYLFALQIYCDFSGYSDIARGSAKLLGFDIMVNFRLPYFSTNPSEFWRRWHISLSTWLRDYLYIPLGGNHHGTAKTYRNLMTTMVLGGLWHGAAWNFVLWGIFQGAILCIHRPFARGGRDVPPRASLRTLAMRAAHVIVFFHVTCYGWLLFRARSFEQIAAYTTMLVTDFGNFSTSIPLPPFATLLGVPLLVLLDACEYQKGTAQFYRRWAAPARGLLYAALAFVFLMGTSNEPSQFIYFQF